MVPCIVRALSGPAYARAARRVGIIRRVCGLLHLLRNFHNYDTVSRRGIVRRIISAVRPRGTVRPLPVARPDVEGHKR